MPLENAAAGDMNSCPSLPIVSLFFRQTHSNIYQTYQSSSIFLEFSHVFSVYFRFFPPFFAETHRVVRRLHRGSRLQRLLRFDDDGFGVAESLRRYAMSAAARGGRQGALSQAFVQRYELDGDETTCNRRRYDVFRKGGDGNGNDVIVDFLVEHWWINMKIVE